MFILKKLVTPFLFPLPVSLLLLTIGVLFLWFGKRQKAGKVFVTLALVILAVFSFDPIPDAILSRLEYRNPSSLSTDRISRVDWIVVLGGGVAPDPDLSPNDQLSLHSLSRLVEGVRLSRMYPGARLLLSGSGIFTETSEAAVMRRAAIQLGVDSTRIFIEEESLDTDDQARHIKKRIGPSPFFLVTSAFHMRRSLELFHAQGLRPWPAATSHLFKDSGVPWYLQLNPGSKNLVNTDLSWKEYLGMAWYRLRP